MVRPKHAIDEWSFMTDCADPESNVMTPWERSVQ